MKLPRFRLRSLMIPIVIIAIILGGRPAYHSHPFSTGLTFNYHWFTIAFYEIHATPYGGFNLSIYLGEPYS